MGCTQTKTPLEIAVQTTLRECTNIQSSDSTVFYTDKHQNLWKVCTYNTLSESVAFERRLLRVMRLPVSIFILMPQQLIRVDDLRVAIGMRRCGSDFFDIMNSGLEWSTINDYLLHIRSAVHFLHENGLAHRDIKPENVVVDNGIPKLIDFDFSSPLENFEYCGTVNYIAPMRFVKAWGCGDSDKSRKMDVYAFGKCIFAVLLSTASRIPHRNFVLASFFEESCLPNPYGGKRGLWAEIALQCCNLQTPNCIPIPTMS